jgi:sulfur-carrier protein
VLVRVRGVLLRFTNYENDIQLSCETVRDGLEKLTAVYPHLGEVLMDRDGRIRPTHLIVLNGEQLRVAELDRAVGQDDRVDIVTAVSGG